MTELRSLGLAAALLATVATPALALDNVVVGNGRCDCMCETANAGSYSVYDSRGYGCGALENKTCNIENPATGLIETGRLWGCSPTSENLNNAAQLLNNMLDRGDWQIQDGGQAPGTPGAQPGLVAPLPGQVSR